MSRRRRWVPAALVLAAALVGGCGGDETENASPSSTGASEPATEPSGEATDGGGAAFEGTWQTKPIDGQDIARTLADEGLAEHAAAVSADLTAPTVLTLEIDDGYWTQYRAVGEQADEVNDRGTYAVDGPTTLAVTPNSGGMNVYRWTIEDDDLRLELVSTTEPAYAGTPGEAYQRAYYTTASFSRISP